MKTHRVLRRTKHWFIRRRLMLLRALPCAKRRAGNGVRRPPPECRSTTFRSTKCRLRWWRSVTVRYVRREQADIDGAITPTPDEATPGWHLHMGCGEALRSQLLLQAVPVRNNDSVGCALFAAAASLEQDDGCDGSTRAQRHS